MGISSGILHGKQEFAQLLIDIVVRSKRVANLPQELLHENPSSHDGEVGGLADRLDLE
jgi:hypothetical protein